MTPFMGLRGSGLTIAIGVVSGLCFALFGYCQGDFGVFLTDDSFRAQFPQIDTIGHPLDRHVAIIQGITNASWNLGCVVSAFCTIYVGSFLGRKKTIFLGVFFLIVGEILQATSFSLGQLIAGRVIAGFGNGFNTCTIPAWQAETSRAHRRGTLVMITGAFITFGLMMSYWVGFAFAWIETSSAAWRVPIAFQIPMMFLVAIALFFLPESPRWLILNGRAEEALQVLAALDDRSPQDAVVYKEFLAIKDAVIEMGAGGFGAVFKNDESRHGHRTLLACLIQGLQQITGVNLIAQYLALLIVEQTGYTPWVSRLLAGCVGTVAFFFSFVPVVGIDHFWGRRSLMMFGSSGMLVAMILLTVMGAVNTAAAHVVLVVFFFVFMAFFAIGWQGMAWLYSAEIVPLRIRGPANALSTATNWICNFWVVLITPLAFNTIGYNTYIIFIALNAIAIPIVYLYYPETAYRTLEEVDVFFHSANNEKSPYRAVVHISQETPLWYGRDGNIDFDYEASDWHARRQRKGSRRHLTVGMGNTSSSEQGSEETPPSNTNSSSDPATLTDGRGSAQAAYTDGYGGERLYEKAEEGGHLMDRDIEGGFNAAAFQGVDGHTADVSADTSGNERSSGSGEMQRRRDPSELEFNDMPPGHRYSALRPGVRGWILREPGKGA